METRAGAPAAPAAALRAGGWTAGAALGRRPDGTGRSGAVALTLGCLALVGLLALLYLGRVAAVASANQRLQAEQAEQERIARADQALHAQLAAAQDPDDILRRARAMGLVPAPPGSAVVIVVPGVGGAGAGGAP